MTKEDELKASDEAGAQQQIEACKISVKIPPFWIERPDVWFRQVEAQFKLSGVKTEGTKFDYLVSQLDRKFVADIIDILDSESDSKYSLAKVRLLSLYKESEDSQIKRLFAGLELGDLKPSQLLRKMTSLAGTDISSKVLRTLWLDKLPESIRNLLLVSDENLEKLAVMADKIVDMNPRREVYAMSNSKPNSEHCSTSGVDEMMKVLVAKIEAMDARISSLSHSRNGRDRSNDRRCRNRSRSRSRGRFDPKGKYCFYHYRFGERCLPEKCQQPCQWNQEGNGKLQQK